MQLALKKRNLSDSTSRDDLDSTILDFRNGSQLSQIESDFGRLHSCRHSRQRTIEACLLADVIEVWPVVRRPVAPSKLCDRRRFREDIDTCRRNLDESQKHVHENGFVDSGQKMF